MKKTIIALAIAALTATAANATVVYGEKGKVGTVIDVNGRITLELQNTKNNRTDLRDPSTRLRVDAIHQFTEKYGVLAALELRFSKTDTLDSLHVKRAYGGIFHKDIGELTFGRQLTHGDNLDYANFDYEVGTIIKVPDQMTKGIKFTSATFNGFKIGADYYFGNKSKTASSTTLTYPTCTALPCNTAPIATTTTGQGASTGTGFDIVGYYDHKFGDVSVGVRGGFGQTKASTTVFEADQFNVKSHGAGILLGYADTTFGFDYAHVETSKRGLAAAKAGGWGKFYATNVINDDVTQYRTALKYKLTPEDTIQATYIWGNGKTQGDADNDKFRGWVLSAGHEFNKNFLVYLEGGSFKVKEAGQKIDDDKKIALGTRIFF